mmetsp:Transcript_33882/g.30673  ORF Transcript_33882/g.30673 Transcript_33882/m.30673 type:complete len:130 (+) Transcript_33882:306-695(+)
MRPWLMEVNISPSLNTESPLDDMIKTRLMSDTFNMIGLKLNTREGSPEREDDLLGRSSRKPVKMLEKLNANNWLEILSNEDWEILFDAVEEEYRTGHYELIFPLKNNIDKYSKYFEVDRYNNHLLWKYK